MSIRTQLSTRRAAGVTCLLVTFVLLGTAASTPSLGEEEHLATGDLVSRGGVSVTVPDPGVEAWAEATAVDGQVRLLAVRTLADGTVDVEWPVTPTEVVVHVEGLPAGACSDGAYALSGGKWKDQLRWYFKSSTTPTGIDEEAAETSLRNAADNLTHVDNDCGLSDTVWASHWYQGTTSNSPNIGSSSDCLTSDGMNVVGFGTLEPDDLGLACWWVRSGETIESDVKLNKTNYDWYVDKPANCSNEYNVENVATHEFGHVFGLLHVSESGHPSLTMSPLIGDCQGSEKSLGLGDYSGMEAVY